MPDPKDDQVQDQPETGSEQDTPEVTVESLQADLAQTKQALKAANAEAAERRRKLAAFEAAEAERKQAEMTELEKAQAKLSEMEKALQETTQRARHTALAAEFKTQAALLGAAHPEDALALAGDAATFFDADGNVQGVAEAVQALIDAGRLPTAAKRQAPNLDAGAGSGQRTGERKAATATEAEIAVARKMGISVEDYLKNK